MYIICLIAYVYYSLMGKRHHGYRSYHTFCTSKLLKFVVQKQQKGDTGMSKKELLLDYLDRNNGMITYKKLYSYHISIKTRERGSYF